MKPSVLQKSGSGGSNSPAILVIIHLFILSERVMAIPKKMKAAILVEQHQPVVIDQVELPETLDVGQVLVKIHYISICYLQLGEIDGVKSEDNYLPHFFKY